MDLNQKKPSRTESRAQENGELRKELAECRQMIANRMQSALMDTIASGVESDEKCVEQQWDTMRLVFSVIRDMVVVGDAGQLVRMANPVSIKILGYDPTGLPMEKMIADLNLRHINGSAVVADDSPLKQALAGHTAFTQKYLITNRQGFERAVSLCAAPLFRDGRVIGSVAVVRDETEQDAMHARVQLKRAALQEIIDHAPEGIVVVDRQGVITMANPTAEHLCGRSIPKGLSLETLAQTGVRYPAGHAYRAEDLPLSRSVHCGETITNRELMVQRRDGTMRILSASTSPIKDDQGQVNGAVGFFRDVTAQSSDRMKLSADRDELLCQVNLRTAELQSTVRALETQIAERSQIEKELIRSEKKLQRLSRHTLATLESDRKKMAKELHDGIGASLSAIKFIVEEKQAQIERSKSDAHLSLKPVIQHLTQVIKETKSVSARLRPSTLDDLGLHATLSWYCREFASFQQGIRIEHQIDVSEGQIPEDYKIVIYRIVQEAMINAAKHARPALIRTTIVKEKEQIRLVVEDNGSGFDPKQTFASSGPLSGYGLQSMRERTEICGGFFEIDSQVGLGTRIRVWLPLRREGHPPDLGRF